MRSSIGVVTTPYFHLTSVLKLDRGPRILARPYPFKYGVHPPPPRLGARIYGQF